MDNKSEETNKTEVLKLFGDLTIENIQELHKMIINFLGNTKELSLSFEKVTAVDLSFVQLLCSVHRTAVKAEKIMKLHSQYPEVLKAAVRELGFIREKGCVLDSQGSCLWKEGWE